jgi:death-on-curing family protein
LLSQSIKYPLERLSKIDVDRIVKIHEVSIKYGKTFNTGIRDEGTTDILHYIVDNLHKMTDKQKDLVTLSSYLIERIVKDHPFWDGNHRTAFEVCRFVLFLFGYELDIKTNEAVKFMREIDDKNLSNTQIKKWINDRLSSRKAQ